MACDAAAAEAGLPGLALFGLLRFGDAEPSQTDAMCRLLSDTPLAVYEAMEGLDLIPDLPESEFIPESVLLRFQQVEQEEI